MSFFNRMSTLFRAKANEALDEVEAKNAIPILKEKIEELKRDYASINTSRAEHKSRIKITEKNIERGEKESALNLQKAKELKAQGTDEAMQLAKEYVSRHLECVKRIEPLKTQLQTQKAQDDEFRRKADRLQDTIRQWQSEIVTLEARSKTAEAELEIEKTLSQTDPDSTLAMMEKLKSKVESKEALASSYRDIGNESKSLDQKADELLSKSDSSVDDLLSKL
ncbi:PspA/IM30 family protein [Pseudobacteriovorax antillogorgiicola]|uniref:Phage shock protein A (PspA) family protein n=1 Tax=Pseudobacteriovorax antillogorgiicola TaxID=1513793 RepID=A0A1Y6CYW8_9BACT|nr:PspA/IM30 family protein [Pseudobacteriovorax antillogorgiicola]TCS41265.1 phage shock protein A (PspA) family protein [Pseudobacteriovorax antillogorgiicola]SMF83772.1 phage shock protein A (PspA) family protein [Pseudobacteriovorax antillogorgiicola]